MDIALLLNETSDTMPPEPLSQFVDPFEVQGFLKNNKLAADIADDMQNCNVLSIECEVWKRQIDGKTKHCPVLVFVLDNLENLFAENPAAHKVYNIRLAQENAKNCTKWNSLSATQQVTPELSQKMDCLPEIKAYKEQLKKEADEALQQNNASLNSQAPPSSEYTIGNMDEKPEIKAYKELLQREAWKEVQTHIDYLDQKVIGFMNHQRAIFNKFREDSFETVYISINGTRRQIALTPTSVAKLLSENSRVFVDYKKNCVAALKDYKKDLKSQCERHLANIERECRALLRKNSDGKVNTETEESLGHVVPKGRQFDPPLPVIDHNNAGHQHMIVDFFREEMRQDLQNFEELMNKREKNIERELHQPMVLGDVNVVFPWKKKKTKTSLSISAGHLERPTPAAEQNHSSVGGLKQRISYGNNVQRRSHDAQAAMPSEPFSDNPTPTRNSVNILRRVYEHVKQVKHGNGPAPAPNLTSATNWCNDKESPAAVAPVSHQNDRANEIDANSLETIDSMEVEHGSVNSSANSEGAITMTAEQPGPKPADADSLKKPETIATEGQANRTKPENANSIKGEATLENLYLEAPGVLVVYVERKPKTDEAPDTKHKVVVDLTYSPPNPQQEQERELPDYQSPSSLTSSMIPEVSDRRRQLMEACLEHDELLRARVEPQPKFEKEAEIQEQFRGRSISEMLGMMREKKRKRGVSEVDCEGSVPRKTSDVAREFF